MSRFAFGFRDPRGSVRIRRSQKRAACRQVKIWQTQFPNYPQLKVSVNLSAQQLREVDLIEQIDQILAETGLHGSSLALEITESMLIENVEQVITLLSQLHLRSIQVSIDDFGTGYSSLETLRAFPFDKIKLDRLFVRELEDSPQAVAIIRAVLALGKSLSIPVLAEGIETEKQLGVLRREGCDEVQGFLLGYPQAEAGHDQLPLNRDRDEPLEGQDVSDAA